ncbi:hypothetical protein SAMN04487846_3020 [Microbacterium sp. cf046]|uniref:hypothetical protein n=1 Tax=Microbacterium sp. cf046 TaxID=1761803 RepID=UPI0008EBD9D3|nr:hypothetical protein [Microbacterium sp. cf046]SFS14984.1 hypothetical protein SAMN04487846_3020 [Microbacterium sp. cf046]
MAHDASPSPSGRTKWSVAALYGLVGGLVIAVLVMAFVWPAATSKPQNLPIGISGPADRVAALEAALEEQDPAPFTLVAVDSRDDAVTQIESRALYGAILLDGPEVLVATAASPIAAQALRGVATQLQSQITETVQAALIAQLQQLGAALASGQPPATPPSAGGAPEIPQVTVTDVVPLADSDPTGAGLAAAAFPLTIGGMLGGILLSLLVAGAVRRLVGLLVFGVAAGVFAALVMQTWFGLLQGDWLLNAAALGLGMTATAAFIIGMNAVLGRAGLGIAAIITILLANPIAGAAAPWQFLPVPWGQIGQFFVPGAASNLIRSLSYFPDAPTAMQWTILACWLAGGVLLTLIGHYRDQADLPVPADQLEPVPDAEDQSRAGALEENAVSHSA